MNNILSEDYRQIFFRTKNIHKCFKDKKILMVGSNGFLGQYFIKFFEELSAKYNFQLDAVDNLITSKKISKKIKKIKFMKRDISKLKITKQYDYILFLAGIASPYYYKKFPLDTIEVSYSGLKNCLSSIKNKKTKLVFFSSSEIYGDPDKKNIPTKETYRGNVSSYGPRSCYDEGKRIGETLCYIFNTNHNINTCIIRPFNVYGPGMAENDYRVIPNLIKSFLKKNIFKIYGSGNQTRSYCYITDAVVGFLNVIAKGGRGEIYNIGNPKEEIDLFNLINKFKKVVDNKIKIKRTAYPSSYPEDEPQRRCPDIRKSFRHFGFNPIVNLSEGLKRLVSHALSKSQ
tara:strand:+ start:5826 stop:6854 length:1029 start_codon:yes stop_codon:yes gene_type:complete